MSDLSPFEIITIVTIISTFTLLSLLTILTYYFRNFFFWDLLCSNIYLSGKEALISKRRNMKKR
jgi:hypothetical protein